MIPTLYDKSETEFRTQGLGALTDAISCTVEERINGIYEAVLEYPVSGLHYNEIRERGIFTAQPSPYRDPQPFRIYRSSKPMSGVCKFYARHISYDLSGIPVRPFNAVNAIEAMDKLTASAIIPCPFTFTTDKAVEKPFVVAVPSSIRSLMGGQEGSLLDIYGGYYDYDKHAVKLLTQRGQDRGVTIEYGKNLIDAQQEANISRVRTGIVPYWTEMSDASGQGLVVCDPPVVPAPGSYSFAHVEPVDFSGDFDEAPTPEQLQARAEQYVEDNRIGIPAVSVKASFVALEQCLGNEDLALLERIDLGDTVTIRFVELGIDVKARIVRTVHNVLLDRYETIEIGEVRQNLAGTVAGQQQSVDKITAPGFVQGAATEASRRITGGLGGYVLLHSSTGGTMPDEILIMDTPDIATAVRVWRWNKGGLGYSSTGYNGPYGLAITQDGEINADYIKAGTIDAALVKVINLVADHVRSPGPEGSGTEMEIDGAKLALKRNGKKHFLIDYVDEGNPHMYLERQKPEDADYSLVEVTGNYIKCGGKSYDVDCGLAGVMGDRTRDSEAFADQLRAYRSVEIKGRQSNPPDNAKLTATKNSITMVNADQQQLFSVREFKGQMLADIAGSLKTERRIVYDGLCRVGTRFTVYSGFEDCNLFAVRLGTENGAYNTAVLAYRYGTSIRGIGGACGTKTTQKEIYFVQIKALSTGEWELEDAGYHTIGSNGVWGAGTRLVLRQVDAIL